MSVERALLCLHALCSTGNSQESAAVADQMPLVPVGGRAANVLSQLTSHESRSSSPALSLLARWTR